MHDSEFAISFGEATGINTALRGKRNPDLMTRSQFRWELRRCGYTLNEDYDRAIVQIVPSKYQVVLSM